MSPRGTLTHYLPLASHLTKKKAEAWEGEGCGGDPWRLRGRSGIKTASLISWCWVPGHLCQQLLSLEPEPGVALHGQTWANGSILQTLQRSQGPFLIILHHAINKSKTNRGEKVKMAPDSSWIFHHPTLRPCNAWKDDSKENGDPHTILWGFPLIPNFFTNNHPPLCAAQLLQL